MSKKKINSILIANRGVPAVRIINSCRDRKIATHAVYSTPDRLALHVLMADRASHIGEAPPIESYLNKRKIIKAALKAKVDAIHPGWGFLAENAAFAHMVENSGLIWIGPDSSLIELMGDKIRAKEIAVKAKVPVIPGKNGVKTISEILEWMRDDGVSYPILIKASAGGGGKGMVKIYNENELKIGLEQAKSEATKSFASDVLLVEKYIEHGKHIEVQIIADKHGNTLHLFDRECTIQRRNQKIIEECPSPSLTEDLHQEVCQKAVDLMHEIGYNSAGTVEFIYDIIDKKFYFLEVNTRLQVEHGITELVTGHDIVNMMIDIAEGKQINLKQAEIVRNRTAIEVRLNAEDPRNFTPSFGKINFIHNPFGSAVRVLEGIYQGSDVPPYYDSLLMLIMSVGATRKDALHVMDRTLSRNFRIEGVKTLQPLLLNIIRHEAFHHIDFTTSFIDNYREDLLAGVKGESEEDPLSKIARYVAEVSALGVREWI